MYKGLQPKKPMTFPVHQIWKYIIKKEWEEPEKKLFTSMAITCNYLFEDDTQICAKCPKVDASLSNLANKSDLFLGLWNPGKTPWTRRQSSC